MEINEESSNYYKNKFEEGEMDKVIGIDDCSKESMPASKEIESHKVCVKNENLQDKNEENIKNVMLNDDTFNLIAFVGNLNEKMSADDLKTFMKETGFLENEISEIGTFRKFTTTPKPLAFCFVKFCDEHAFQKALALNNSFHFEQNLIVLPSRKTHFGLFLMEKGEIASKDDDDDDYDNDDKVLNADFAESPEMMFVPVYKKSDHVAYLKHLPLEVSEDDILQFFNFSRSDIVDITVLRNSRNKSNSKLKEVRAVIAFPSEENLKKCLSQTLQNFKNHCIEIERHGMTKKANIGEKRSYDSNTSTEKITDEVTALGMTSAPEKQELNAATGKNSENIDKMELDLFVKHINWNASERIIHDFFASVGAKVLGMKQFGDSGAKVRGMGFVTMADKESLFKGLSLNGALLMGNKIKISIRNDRKFLQSPIKEEIPVTYSTFVSNLPIKKNVDSLKLSLSESLKESGCSVKNIHVPFAENHSGNRGYAFVTFQDEKSLLKALKLNGSVVKICDCKVNIIVSNTWPENPKEISDCTQKQKELNSRRINPVVDTEMARSGRLNKRRRKGLPSPHRGISAKTYKDPIKRSFMHSSNIVEYQLNQQLPTISSQDVYGSDYNAYLDYLEFRDYVALRKVYDEQQDVTDCQALHESRQKEFHPKQNNIPSYFATAPQSSFGPIAEFPELVSQTKEGNLGNTWNSSSLIHLRSGDSGGFEHNSKTSASIGCYETPPQTQPVPSSRYDKLTESDIPDSSYRYEKLPSVINPNSILSASRDKQDLHYIPSHTNKDLKVISSSVWTAASNKYTDDKMSSSQWCNSGKQNYWERRDSNSLPPSVLNKSDASNRIIQLSAYNTNYTTERGSNAHPRHLPLQGTSHLNVVNTSTLHSSKKETDLSLYSRFDRRPSPFNVPSGPTSVSSVFSSGSGVNNLYSHPYSDSGISIRSNQHYAYADNAGVGTKCVDEQRNGSYDKSGSFVSKLVTSGILSSAGYNVSTGYHDN